MGDKTATGWLARRHQQYVDRAAQRMHDQLAARPESYAASPSTLGVLALSVGVLMLAAAAIAVLIWQTVQVDSWQGGVAVALCWLVVAALFPRPHGLPDETTVLDPVDFPGVHRLVQTMARAVDVTPPLVVAVDLEFNAAAGLMGWRARPTVILGLPMWAMESPEQRLATLGHELGHLRGADGLQGRIVVAAQEVLYRGLFVLTPFDRREWSEDVAFLSWIVVGVQLIVAAPFWVLLWAVGRMSAQHRQHREFLADRRSAEVVGSEAMVAALCEDIGGTHTVVKSASARGENPFEVLEARSVQGLGGRAADVVKQADWSHRADASHPPDALRISLLQGRYLPPGLGLPDPATRQAAADEMRRLQETLTKRFRDKLGIEYY